MIRNVLRINKRIRRVVFMGVTLLFIQPVWGHWVDAEEDLPPWAQRGALIFFRSLSWENKEKKPLEEQVQSLSNDYGLPPLVDSCGPGEWTAEAIRLLDKAGIPLSTRTEGSFFWEYDWPDQVVLRLSSGPAGGWWMYHGWRGQQGWYFHMPEMMQAVVRLRDGSVMGEYWVGQFKRGVGCPLNPIHRKMRERYYQWLINGKDPFPGVPYRNYEPVCNKEDGYAAVGHFSGIWLDNPLAWCCYCPHCQLAWRKHFQEKFGQEVWDPQAYPLESVHRESPPFHAVEAVHREFSRFHAEAYTSLWLYYYDLIQRLGKAAGKPHVFISGNFSWRKAPGGAPLLYAFSTGAFDHLGPAEEEGRCIWAYKAAMAASHGKAAGRWRGRNVAAAAEALANQATVAVDVPSYQEFRKVFRDLLTNQQQGGKVAMLYHSRHSLVDPENAFAVEWAEALLRLGIPFEVIVESDLTPELLNPYRVVMVTGSEFNAQEVEHLRKYVEEGGGLLSIGDNIYEPVAYFDLKNPPEFKPNIGIMKAFNKPEWEDQRFEFGKGKVVNVEAQQITDEALLQALSYLGGLEYRMGDAKQGAIVLNISTQPKKTLTLLHLVNHSGELQKEVKVHLPLGCAGCSAAMISPEGNNLLLSVSQKGKEVIVTMPELPHYALILIGKDQGTLQKFVETAKARFVRPADFKMMEGEKRETGMMPPKEMPQGKRLGRIHAGPADRGISSFDADVLYPGQVKVGDSAKLDLNIIHTCTHGGKGAFYEYFKFLLQHLETGKVEEVPVEIPLGPPLPTETREWKVGKEVPLVSTPIRDARALIGLKVSANWKPKKPGKYQGYLSYRYVNVFMHGEPNLMDPAKPVQGIGKVDIDSNLLMKSTPFEKILCLDKIHRMVITVGE